MEQNLIYQPVASQADSISKDKSGSSIMKRLSASAYLHKNDRNGGYQ